MAKPSATGLVSEISVAALCRRRLPVTRASGAAPWVYVDDAASATIAALELGERSTAYNITDDEPVSTSAMLTAMAATVGAPRPRAVPDWLVCRHAIRKGDRDRRVAGLQYQGQG